MLVGCWLDYSKNANNSSLLTPLCNASHHKIEDDIKSLGNLVNFVVFCLHHARRSCIVVS